MPQVPRLTGPQVSRSAIQPQQMRAMPQNRLGALGDIAGDVAQMAAREQRETERAQIVEADNAMAQWETEAIYGQNGALAKQGKNALGIAGQALPDFETQVKRAESGLQTNWQKSHFRQMALERRSSIERTLSRHESREAERYHDEQDDAFMTNSVRAAANQANDPAAIATELGRQRSVISQIAARKGWSPEETEVKRGELEASTHAQVISRLVSDSQGAKASEYLKSVGSVLPPEMRDKLQSVVSGARVDETATRLLKVFGTDMKAGDAAMAGLAKSGLSEVEQIAVRGKVRSGIGLLNDERRRLYADEVTSLERSITLEQPAANAEDLAVSLYRRGAYSPEQLTNVLQGIDVSRVKAAKADADANALTAIITAGGALDPKNKDHRDYVSADFSRQVKGVQPGSQAWQVIAANTASRTGILPAPVGAFIRTSVLSGNPQKSVEAALTLDAINDANPAALEYVDADTKSFSLQVAQMVAAGTDPEKAVEMTRKFTFEATPQLKETLKTQYAKTTKKDDNASALGDLLDSDDRYDKSIFRGAPEAPIGMQADFDSLVERYYATTGGNLDTARALAYNDLQARWGRSTSNGKAEIMRYSPERFGISGDVIRKEIADTFGERAKNIRLIPDAQTGRQRFDEEGNVAPISYSLVEMDPETGLFDALPDRYNLPSAADITTQVNADRARKIEEAKASVAQRRATREFLTSDRTLWSQ